MILEVQLYTILGSFGGTGGSQEKPVRIMNLQV
jgi:hypothetical protein